MAYKPKAPDVIPDINVVPMADIMLVLLIIFMVVTPMMQTSFSVDLAPTANPREMPDADKDDAVVVAITRSGNFYLGNRQIASEQITQKVKDMLANRLDKTVYVKSDARAKYVNVVEVVDEIRATGVDQIGLLTEKVQRRGIRTVPVPQAPPAGAEASAGAGD